MHYRFLKKLFAFVAVIAIGFFSLFECMLHRLGETGSFNRIVREQLDKGVLFGPKYMQQNLILYKLEGAMASDPEILVLGTSRVSSIDQRSFSENTYNAFIPASGFDDFNHMMFLLKEMEKKKLPDIILVGLDPWFFNPSYPNNNRSTLKQFLKDRIKIGSKTYMLLNFFQNLPMRFNAYRSLLLNERNILKILFRPDLYNGFGLNSKILNTGYENDGSYKWPEQVGFDWKEHSVKYYVKDLEKNRYRFHPSEYLFDKSMSKLRLFLSYAKKNKIEVIGFLPPFSKNFLDAITESKKHKNFMQKYRNHIPHIFETEGFYCFDFCEISWAYERDKEFIGFIDELHPSEQLMSLLMEDIKDHIKFYNLK